MITQEAKVDARIPPKDNVHLPVSAGQPRWLAFLLPALAFGFISIYFGSRAWFMIVPEGDSTLHLHFMEIVAKGQLPKTIPYFAAIVGEGGVTEAFFPYSYTPLFHFLGGAVFKVGGESAVLMMNPFWAGIIAVGMVYLLRSNPWPVGALAIGLFFFHWLTHPVMTWILMEPMMLAFFVGGLWFYQRAWAGYSIRAAALAGVFFGLAVATRQSALLYVVFVALHAGGTLLFAFLRGLRGSKVRDKARNYAVMAATMGLVSLPFLAYLIWTSGTIGYGDLSIPGIDPQLPIDDVANQYVSAISTPAGTPLAWFNTFWSWTLFTGRWQPQIIAYLAMVFFGIGLWHLATRGDKASRFLASYASVHIVAELVGFLILHGNWRYIVATRMLFSMIVAVGVWYVISAAFQIAKDGARQHRFAAGMAGTALAAMVIAPTFVSPGLVDYLIHRDEDRSEKGVSYRELGEFTDDHVPEDALILSGRWYTTGWYLRRNYTWVNYFGNAWVIDAISDKNPEVVRDILEQYGIDYIVFQAPLATYIDRMPQGGLRTIVLDDLEHFQLVFRNERTRLYRFWPDGMQRLSRR